MNEKKIILGIETSCDETAVSIIEEDKNGKIKLERVNISKEEMKANILRNIEKDK